LYRNKNCDREISTAAEIIEMNWTWKKTDTSRKKTLSRFESNRSIISIKPKGNKLREKMEISASQK
jgi:hypothetical protein